MRKNLAVGLMVALIVLSLSFAASAADVVIRLGWAETEDPLSHQKSGAFAVFKDYVEQESGGEIEVRLYPAAQLGDAADMLEQVQQGILEACGSVPSGLLAGTYYSNMYIFDIPYLFSSNGVAWKTLRPEQPFVRELSDDLAEKTGIRLLTFFVEGQRHFTNDVRPIESPEDMEGLRIRTMEVPAHQLMVRRLGASPTPVAWTELYTALQTGVVDGQENPISNILYINAHEVQQYLTLDGHITLLNTFLMNDNFYQSLSDDHRRIVDEAVQMAAITNRGLSQVFDVQGLKELENKGMEITALTAEQLELFREATQPDVVDFIRNEVEDETWVDRVLEEVAKAEELLGR